MANEGHWVGSFGFGEKNVQSELSQPFLLQVNVQKGISALERIHQ